MNRLVQYFEEAEEPREPEMADSYWVVETTQYWFAVAPETARAIEQQLARRWGPRWLTFTDSWGVPRRIPRAGVNHIFESTPALRAAARAFYRARKLEELADRRAWEEND